MFDLSVECFGCRILSEPENVAAADPSEAPGAGNEQKAERAHAPEQVGVGPFARARLGLGERVELEVPSEVVGEDAQLLPGAVGAVVVGGDDVERELALEFGEGLLLGAPATDEGEERREAQGHVGRDGVVLEGRWTTTMLLSLDPDATDTYSMTSAIVLLGHEGDRLRLALNEVDAAEGLIIKALPTESDVSAVNIWTA